MRSKYDRPSSDDTSIYDYDGPVCIYCGEPCPYADLSDYEPYCSALCAAMADRDNREDR